MTAEQYDDLSLCWFALSFSHRYHALIEGADWFMCGRSWDVGFWLDQPQVSRSEACELCLRVYDRSSYTNYTCDEDE